MRAYEACRKTPYNCTLSWVPGPLTAMPNPYLSASELPKPARPADPPTPASTTPSLPTTAGALIALGRADHILDLADPMPASMLLLSTSPNMLECCRPQPEPAGPHLRQQVHPHHRQRQRAPAPCLGQLLHGPARSCPAHACRPGVLLPPPHPCIPLPDPLRGHCSLLLGRHGEQFFSSVMVSKLGWGLGTASGLGAGA